MRKLQLIRQNYGLHRIITFIQEKKIKEVSIALESDRRNRYELYNEWMQRDIEYCDNLLPDGQEEFEMLITIDNIYYYFSGMMPREEYETILKKALIEINACIYYFTPIYFIFLLKANIPINIGYKNINPTQKPAPLPKLLHNLYRIITAITKFT